MIKKDYSKNAQLLDVEIDDFDTVSYMEEGEHPIGINDGRMRLPDRYDISKFYLRNKRNREKGRWVKKEDVIDFTDDFDWQITYSFPATLRDNQLPEGSYGASHMTFRRLYLILCERFNGGDYFIDDYFDSVYPYTIKPEVDKRLERIKAYLIKEASDFLEGAVATKSGKLASSFVYKQNKGMREKLRRYETFKKNWEAIEGDSIASYIKNDIISCMMSGQLQAQCIGHLNQMSTIRRKEELGISNPVFVATEQLINSLQLYVKIGGKKSWQTRQGILV